MKINWGIIGCGNVTEKKSGPAFQKIKNSRLIAVMRRDAALAEDYAKRHEVSKWYTNPEMLINNPEINAIYIATPPYVHLEYVTLAAKANKPVYVEKPVGISYEECLAMNTICEKANIPFFTAYYRRAQPRFLKVKEIIDNGLIGEIQLVNVMFYSPPLSDDFNSEELPWRLRPEFSGGGRFIDIASHALDILDFTIGPISHVKGFASNQAHLYEAEDIVSGIFVFGKNNYGSGTWCFTAKQKYDHILMIGEKGSIKFGVFSPEEIELDSEKGKEILYFESSEHVQMPMIQTIINELSGKGKCASHGDNALRTWRVMENLIKEYYIEHDQNLP